MADLTRKEALPYVGYILDDALQGHAGENILPNAVLVGWQAGFEPLFVAVQSYLPNTALGADEAIEIATDFLVERKWFADGAKDPDYVITAREGA
jgi:hypothetical protein